MWAWVDPTAAGVAARCYRVELLTSTPPTNPQPDSLAWIPPGTFTRGSPDSEAERGADETQHIVKLSSAFFMDIRGGSWNSYGSLCRSAFRFGLDPSYAFYVTGFRVVLAPAQP
jgi:formylglycine-generating enzyme required for sulfatase activity